MENIISNYDKPGIRYQPYRIKVIGVGGGGKILLTE